MWRIQAMLLKRHVRVSQAWQNRFEKWNTPLLGPLHWGELCEIRGELPSELHTPRDKKTPKKSGFLKPVLKRMDSSQHSPIGCLITEQVCLHRLRLEHLDLAGKISHEQLSAVSSNDPWCSYLPLTPPSLSSTSTSTTSGAVPDTAERGGAVEREAMSKRRRSSTGASRKIRFPAPIASTGLRPAKNCRFNTQVKAAVIVEVASSLEEGELIARQDGWFQLPAERIKFDLEEDESSPVDTVAPIEAPPASELLSSSVGSTFSIMAHTIMGYVEQETYEMHPWWHELDTNSEEEEEDEEEDYFTSSTATATPNNTTPIAEGGEKSSSSSSWIWGAFSEVIGIVQSSIRRKVSV